MCPLSSSSSRPCMFIIFFFHFFIKQSGWAALCRNKYSPRREVAWRCCISQRVHTKRCVSLYYSARIDDPAHPPAHKRHAAFPYLPALVQNPTLCTLSLTPHPIPAGSGESNKSTKQRSSTKTAFPTKGSSLSTSFT